MSEDTRADLSVRVTEDRLRVLVDCLSPGDDLEALLERLVQELDALGLGDAVQDMALADWLARQSQQGFPIRDAVLLEGRAAVPPTDGWIEWAGPFFETGFVVDEATGAIDYRQHAAQRSVRPGQLLARRHPPQDGVDGEDLFGGALRVRAAQPARIRAGQNVSTNESGSEFCAAREGRIRWASGVLSVDQVYRIRGSVGLETGHIRHSGAVEIEKDVEEGARVEADGDIEIKQVLEPADVVCGGSLTVRGGVAGRKGRKVRVRGSVQARFLLDTDMEADGDVAVEREIVRCAVKTRGAVVMPHGRIIGGSVTALGGIEVSQAGSVASVPTVLRVGEDFRLADQLAAVEKRVAGFQERVSQIELVIEPVLENLNSLPFEKAQAIRSLAGQAEELRKALKDSRDEADAIREESQARTRSEAVVRDVIFPETLICIHRERLRLKEEVRGPVRAVYRDGQVRLRSMS